MKPFLLWLAMSCAVMAEPLTVAVANYPLKYFTERIGGADVKVIFPVPADEDPAFWQPKDADVEAYQKADLILMNGATYSKWAEKRTLPRSRTVDTGAAFKDKLIVTKGTVTHSHGPGGEHSHDGVAFTTWMDFQQAIAQAEAVRDALVKKRPAAKAALEQNCAALRTELTALDERLLAAGKKFEGKPLMASHPIYQYFARRYGLTLKAMLWEPDQMPDEAQWGELKKQLEGHAAKWMLWEDEPLPASVEKLKAMGLKSVTVAPCANAPEKGDFMTVMKRNVEAFEAAAAE